MGQFIRELEMQRPIIAKRERLFNEIRKVDWTSVNFRNERKCDCRERIVRHRNPHPKIRHYKMRNEKKSIS